MDNDRLIHPAELVVRAFGGVRAAARLLNCEASTVSRWKQSGKVPAGWQKEILKAAWERGIDLTAHDLIFGREVV